MPQRSRKPYGGYSASCAVIVAGATAAVGRATIAANLAFHLRAARCDLPLLLISEHGAQLALPGVDPTPCGCDSDGEVAEVTPGRHGVHVLPRFAQTLAADLPGLLDQLHWSGLVIADARVRTDEEASALLGASDLVLVPVRDRASLRENRRFFRRAKRRSPGVAEARIVLSRIPRGSDSDGEKAHRNLVDLVAAIRRLSYPLSPNFVSESASRSEREEREAQRRRTPGVAFEQGPETLFFRQLALLADEVWASIAPRVAPVGGGERRRKPRLPFVARVPAFGLPEVSIAALRARDLSETGLGLEAHPRLAAASGIEVLLPQPADGDAALVKGRVIRAETGGSAIEFDGGGVHRSCVRDLLRCLAPERAELDLHPGAT